MIGLVPTISHPGYESRDGVWEFPIGDDSYPLSLSQFERGQNTHPAQREVHNDGGAIHHQVIHHQHETD